MRAQPRVDGGVVGDRVAAVVLPLARRQQRHQVQVRHAQLGEVVQPLPDAGEGAAEAVGVAGVADHPGALEPARVDLAPPVQHPQRPRAGRRPRPAPRRPARPTSEPRSVRRAVEQVERLDHVEVQVLQPGHERLALQLAEPLPGGRTDRGGDRLQDRRRAAPPLRLGAHVDHCSDATRKRSQRTTAGGGPVVPRTTSRVGSTTSPGGGSAAVEHVQQQPGGQLALLVDRLGDRGQVAGRRPSRGRRSRPGTPGRARPARPGAASAALPAPSRRTRRRPRWAAGDGPAAAPSRASRRSPPTARTPPAPARRRSRPRPARPRSRTGRAEVVTRPTGSPGSPEIIAMSRCPSSSRCRTAVPGAGPVVDAHPRESVTCPPTTASGTPSARSASCSSGPNQDATVSTASTRRRSGIALEEVRPGRPGRRRCRAAGRSRPPAAAPPARSAPR